ncbi:hypothetical protein [Nocardia sp. CDC160]|uniref:hypothetical protein n=1 Tax=Nocardia sp. CDC160 TaxID=3112166 RepID=UPI002DBE0D7E|nr:hypothetical protein [Nocardia sp. CDC160]MEC3917911.1 hypothetical protein [Nocardia sp. CDC160]
MADELLAEAHRFLIWARENGADLDGTDESVFFVQGVVESMSTDGDEEPSLRAVKLLAYSVYLAEVLAATCPGVTRVVKGEVMHLEDVYAVHENGTVEFTLNWIRSCLDDPEGDNVVFKYAGALRDFGERDRSRALTEMLEALREEA